MRSSISVETIEGLGKINFKAEMEMEDVDAIALALLMQVVQSVHQGRSYRHLMEQLRGAMQRSPAVREAVANSIDCSLRQNRDLN